MKKIKSLFGILSFCAPLALGGCGDMPRLSVFGPNYKPMTYDVAVMAAPENPAVPGRSVRCRVSKGAARFGDSWEDFKPADFTVSSAVHATVTLSPLRGGKEASFQAYFDDEGQKMIFCPTISGPPDKKVACASIYALDDDLEDGIKRTFDIPEAVQGGAITCARDAKGLKK